jgi:hypothetical protein
MTPTDFRRALAREFHDDLRLRWSQVRRTWLLEAKAGRGLFDIPVAAEEWRRADEQIQLRDGYRPFMEIREYPKMPCPGCGAGLKLKPFESIQATCPRCKATSTVACYPLGDTLLDRLRQLNPKGTYRQNLAREVDRHNAARTRSAEREVSTTVEAGTRDLYNDMVGIPSFGYTGRTGAWTDAPASPGSSHAA